MALPSLSDREVYKSRHGQSVHWRANEAASDVTCASTAISPVVRRNSLRSNSLRWLHVLVPVEQRARCGASRPIGAYALGDADWQLMVANCASCRSQVTTRRRHSSCAKAAIRRPRVRVEPEVVRTRSGLSTASSLRNEHACPDKELN